MIRLPKRCRGWGSCARFSVSSVVGVPIGTALTAFVREAALPPACSRSTSRRYRPAMTLPRTPHMRGAAPTLRSRLLMLAGSNVLVTSPCSPPAQRIHYVFLPHSSSLTDIGVRTQSGP